jgi:hypothetical protein
VGSETEPQNVFREPRRSCRIALASEAIHRKLAMMKAMEAVEEVETNQVVIESSPAWWPSIQSWLIGTVLALLVGSWLIWLSAYVQRKFAEQDIRAACYRVMPETAERCFDTVIIQRGGVRR